MKISNKQAVELLEQLPLDQVANEANFLAPLLTTNRTATIVCEDVNYGKRMLAGELGSENVWWELEYIPEQNKVKLTGTVQEDSVPVKVLS